MKLIFTKTGEEVAIGDNCVLSGGNDIYKVTYFTPPHKPESQGKVTVQYLGDPDAPDLEYYVGIIGAKWINREDQDGR